MTKREAQKISRDRDFSKEELIALLRDAIRTEARSVVNPSLSHRLVLEILEDGLEARTRPLDRHEPLDARLVMNILRETSPKGYSQGRSSP